MAKLSDKNLVTRLTQRAAQILEAAESASSAGERCTEMSILIGADGSVQMFASSDWPLDSLSREHGAIAAYRVSERQGAIRVTAIEGTRRCVMESPVPMNVARALLAAR